MKYLVTFLVIMISLLILMTYQDISCRIDLKNRMAPPGIKFPLGTDRLGRNLLYRIPVSAAQTLLICLRSLFITLPGVFFICAFSGSLKGRLPFNLKNSLFTFLLFAAGPAFFLSDNSFIYKNYPVPVEVRFFLFYIFFIIFLPLFLKHFLITSPYERGSHKLDIAEFICSILKKISSVWLIIPAFAFGIMIASSLGPSVKTLIIITSMLVWPYSVKIILSAAVQTSENDSIKASWALGAGELHILFNNTLPLIYPHMEQAVFQTLLMCLSISSVLAYLDIGESGRSSLTLGGVLADAYNSQAWWIIFIPSLFFVICAVILICLIKKWFATVE